MRSIFFLDSVLSTKIITLIYWLLLLVNNLFAIGLMMGGFAGGQSQIEAQQVNGVMGIFAGLGLLIFGNLIIRLWAEFTVVMFKIQQNTYKTAERIGYLIEQNRKYPKQGE